MSSNQDLQGRTDLVETLLTNVPPSWQHGILTFERSKGGVKESGDIVFLNGQMIDAHAGGHTGQEALEWLKTWRACSYNFIMKHPQQIEVPQYPDVPETPATGNSLMSAFSFVNQVIQKNLSPTTEPMQADDIKTATNSSQSSMHGLPTTGPYKPVTSPNYQNPSQQTNRPQQPPQSYPNRPQQPLPSYANRPQQPPQPHELVPYRLMDGPQVMAYMQSANLSRQHRHIFFLLDGQRTIDDLTRLTQRPLFEIVTLLSELERFGLVRQRRI